MSTADASVILLTTSIMMSAAAPAVDEYVTLAREVRVQSDLRTIAVTLVRLHARHTAMSAHVSPTLQLLVSRGDTPLAARANVQAWTDPIARGSVELLDDYLVTGVALGAAAERSARGWRGPYLEGPVSSDPWGRRYAVNVAFLRPANGTDVVVLSPGENGVAETRFAQDGSTPGGDDRVALVLSGL